MTSTTYLITGASRGIGFGLLSEFLARPDTICIAAVRDPTASTEKLQAITTGSGSKLIVVKIDSGVATDARDAVEELKNKHKIEKIDTVIANAGISKQMGGIIDVTTEALQEHINVNAVGPLTLFQAVLPLLKASPSPKFCLMGSAIASFTEMEKHPYPMGAYTLSKVMAHYLVRKIHMEHSGENGNIVAWVMYPGFVQTDLGNGGAQFFGYPQAPDKLEDSIAFLTKSIDEATLGSTGGKFLSFDGGEIGW